MTNNKSNVSLVDSFVAGRFRQKDYITPDKYHYLMEKWITDEMKDIYKQLDKSLDLQERNQLLHALINRSPYINEFLQTKYYCDQQVKRTVLPQSENAVFSSQLGHMANFLLDKYDEVNGKWKEYTTLTAYGHEKGSKRNLEISYEDPSGDEQFVKEKGVVYVNTLHDAMGQTGTNYRLSEEKKREIRKQYLIANLDKYPELKEAYVNWLEFGKAYGFSDDYSKEQQKQIQLKHIETLKGSNHPLSSSKRLYKLREMYNHVGYELSVMMKQLGDSIETKTYSNPVDTNNAVIELAKELSLSDPNHVRALLSYQSATGYERRLEDFPLFKMLSDKHIGDIDSPLYEVIHKFIKVVTEADLSLMEREIVHLIMNDTQIHNNPAMDRMINPYKNIALYINEKYNKQFDKRSLLHNINHKIVPVLVGTYRDIENGVTKKKCNRCKEHKFASETNYGKDRKALKSICKKCAAKKEGKRKQIV
ncbi:hypothetical protein D0469_06920 [Peribacillus saganii]|uniref:Uncharacterized protein n=1 Tax=Peribacillus saganii TaxID=2303992 RepID=A0A372LQ34_9BACI|nr:hypothetical protein [Peribacillus saganii]RFU70325.1 hypothetical protein D0469_06920 [Peribacillus saganii]